MGTTCFGIRSRKWTAADVWGRKVVNIVERVPDMKYLIPRLYSADQRNAKIHVREELYNVSGSPYCFLTNTF